MGTPRDRRNTYSVLNAAKQREACGGRSMRNRPWQTLAASQNIWTRLDRVAVLGEDNSRAQGHSGCVNALHWSSDGSVLVSAGDDTRIHLWRLDPSTTSGDYPLRCTVKIHTGHTNNIFNAHILPGSSRIATCAADRQVRVFDVNRGGLSHHSGELTEYAERQACVKVLKCHRGRVKRIVTENSPDYFLTVAEDGSVRQHDLRTPHTCSKRDGTLCPPPLLKLPLELSTIALSPLTPYNFVVAGDSQYAYLFDRRQIGRHLKEEWGVECKPEDLTSCVRRFGRTQRAKTELAGQEHVTGSRMSQDNGHELLLTYSADVTYLFSTRDSPKNKPTSPSILLSNKRRQLDSWSSDSTSSGQTVEDLEADPTLLDETDPLMDISQDSSDENGEEEHDDDDRQSWNDSPENLRLPIVYPRKRYVGACNVETVKDVNFVGPKDDYVVSGSDDGNFFLWAKTTGKLLDIHEGDGSIVNVIEQHPFLPVLSVSGIDHTVKIFAPSSGSRLSSRISQRDEIVKNNTRQTSLLTSSRIRLSDVFLHYRRAWMGAGEGEEEPDCRYQ